MKAVLFDLDGTLLPMDQEVFVQKYLAELARKGPEMGYGAQKLVQTVMAGVERMAANDGTMTNEERFWDVFLAVYGGEHARHNEIFAAFYQNDFPRVAEGTDPTPLANEAVQVLKAKGYELVLATNPVFPRAATLERMRWAGLHPQDFVYITTFENSTYTKPNLNYYLEILEKIGARPEECLMVGNDVVEDMSAAQLGLDVFLVTDDLINTAGKDISQFPQGTRRQMLDCFLTLPPRE